MAIFFKFSHILKHLSQVKTSKLILSLDHDHPLTKTCLSPKALIQLYVNDPSGAHHGASSGTSLHKRSIDDDDQTQRSKRAHGDSNEFHEPPPPDTLTRVQITPSIFMSMCPALLVQIEQGACNEQAPVAADHSQRPGVGEFYRVRIYNERFSMVNV